VVEADDPGDFPRTIFVLPEMNEFGLANAAIVRMVEAVNTDLDGAVIGDGIDLEGAGNEFSGYFAANIVFDGLHDGLARASQAGFIVIKLQVVGQERSEFVEIATVVGVKELCIKRLDGVKRAGRVRVGFVREWERAVRRAAW
jgi:hypothetical protein